MRVKAFQANAPAAWRDCICDRAAGRRRRQRDSCTTNRADGVARSRCMPIFKRVGRRARTRPHRSRGRELRTGATLPADLTVASPVPGLPAASIVIVFARDLAHCWPFERLAIPISRASWLADGLAIDWLVSEARSMIFKLRGRPFLPGPLDHLGPQDLDLRWRFGSAFGLTPVGRLRLSGMAEQVRWTARKLSVGRRPIPRFKIVGSSLHTTPVRISIHIRAWRLVKCRRWTVVHRRSGPSVGRTPNGT
jgi:hypothetical protein